MISIAWQLCRRHWAALGVLTFWFTLPGFVGAVGFDLSHVLRLSWMASAPVAVYMYQVSSGSQLLGILPLARREVWQITTLVGAVAPALLQLGVAATIWLLASVLLPSSTTVTLVGLDTIALGAVYSLAFLQLVLIATTGLRRQAFVTAALAIATVAIMLLFVDLLPARLSEFTVISALAFWVAAVVGVVIIRLPGSLAAPLPTRPRSYRLTFDLPGIGMLDRLTGLKRILLVQTLFVVLCIGGGLGVALLLDVWLGGRSPVEFVAEELRAFNGANIWVMRPGDSVIFTPMWIIGLANIWTPLARQLRVLPLTPRETTAIFLASPIVIWAVLWLMYLAVYAATIGGPISPRLALFLAISGTSTLANVISLRWKNRIYGMLGVAFVYSFWMLASIVALVLNLTEATVQLGIIGVAFYAAAISLAHNTFVHATSASAAYQRQPKFFDTPARG